MLQFDASLGSFYDYIRYPDELSNAVCDFTNRCMMTHSQRQFYTFEIHAGLSKKGLSVVVLNVGGVQLLSVITSIADGEECWSYSPTLT